MERGRKEAGGSGLRDDESVKPFPTRTILEYLFCFDKGWGQRNLDHLFNRRNIDKN
jgi:hypothetical protein